jgi:hypothetical protein
MPWAAAIPAIIGAVGSVAGAAITANANKGVGLGRLPQIRDAGGLTLNTGNVGKFEQTTSVTSSPFRQGLVDQQQGAFNTLAGQLGDLRGQLNPNFSAFQGAFRASNEANRSRALSNLQENLSRRKVLGSSFGQDAAARLEAEFNLSQMQGDVLARQSFLQELDQATQLTFAESQARIGAVQTQIDELNLQTQLAVNLITGTNQAIAANSRAQAALAAAAAAGQGAALGTATAFAAEAVKQFQGNQPPVQTPPPQPTPPPNTGGSGGLPLPGLGGGGLPGLGAGFARSS